MRNISVDVARSARLRGILPAAHRNLYRRQVRKGRRRPTMPGAAIPTCRPKEHWRSTIWRRHPRSSNSSRGEISGTLHPWLLLDPSDELHVALFLVPDLQHFLESVADLQNCLESCVDLRNSLKSVAFQCLSLPSLKTPCGSILGPEIIQTQCHVPP